MSFKVYEFQCAAGHIFEAWFKAACDWRDELREGRLSCPVCGSSELEKRLSAPNVAPVRGTTRTDLAADARRREAARARSALRAAVAKIDDVGERFPEEARAIARGESERRAVRGRCSPDEAERLREEGVPVAPLPDYLTQPDN